MILQHNTFMQSCHKNDDIARFLCNKLKNKNYGKYRV